MILIPNGRKLLGEFHGNIKKFKFPVFTRKNANFRDFGLRFSNSDFCFLLFQFSNFDVWFSICDFRISIFDFVFRFSIFDFWFLMFDFQFVIFDFSSFVFWSLSLNFWFCQSVSQPASQSVSQSVGGAKTRPPPVWRNPYIAAEPWCPLDLAESRCAP